MKHIRDQGFGYKLFYTLFGLLSIVLLWYYLSYTIVAFTTPQQFPVNSFTRFPLTALVFPAELFSLVFALYFVYTLLTGEYEPKPKGKLKGRPAVALLLPVYNEPESIVERTLKACTNVRWRGPTNLYLLDDSNTDEDRASMARLAKKYKATLITREGNTGYKAGNLNNAIKRVIREPYFVILDADQAPEPEFLEETMDFFSDESVGFVQTPQYFVNDVMPISRAAKIGTNIFFHSQCASKARDHAMPFCGTNVVVRRDVFDHVNGFRYYTSTEDIDLGIRMNEAGFHGIYLPKVLVYGYAPTNYDSYATQQYRWANGNLAILRDSFMQLFLGRFTLKQKVHTFFTLAWWLIGISTLAFVLVPILSLVLGWGTHHTWLPTSLIIILYFNVIFGVGMIYVALRKRTDDTVHLKDALMQYSLITNSSLIYAKAAINAAFKRYGGFVRTDKHSRISRFRPIRINLILAALCFGTSIFALLNATRASDPLTFRTYLPLSLWLLFYGVVLASSIIFVGVTDREVTSS